MRYIAAAIVLSTLIAAATVTEVRGIKSDWGEAVGWGLVLFILLLAFGGDDD